MIGAQPYSFFPNGKADSRDGGVKVDPSAVIQVGSVVEDGTRRATTIGKGCRIGSLVYIGHDTIIGERVEVASGARIAGHCDIADDVYIGMGACIRQHIRVGAGAMIGMGAVVVDHVEANAVVVGNPAKFLRWRKK